METDASGRVSYSPPSRLLLQVVGSGDVAPSWPSGGQAVEVGEWRPRGSAVAHVEAATGASLRYAIVGR